MKLSFLVASIALGLALSGCAYKPLHAPCSPDEGDKPLAYADPPPALPTPEPFRAFDACGPIKPI